MRTSIPIALALTAAVSASPLPRGDYVIYLDTGYKQPDGSPTYVSANALQRGNEYIVTGERLSVYPGTPVYFNGAGSTQGLFFKPDVDHAYGANIVPAGHAWGNVHPVTLNTSGRSDNQWSYDAKTGAITHKITATTNGFYLCDEEVNGNQHGVLKFGNPNYDNSPVKGCRATSLRAIPRSN